MYPTMKKNVKGSGDMSSIRSILKLENISNEANDLCDAFMQCEYQKIILKRPLTVSYTHLTLPTILLV